MEKLEQQVQQRIREEIGFGILANSKAKLIGSVQFVGEIGLNVYKNYGLTPSNYAQTYFLFKSVETPAREGLAAMTAEIYDSQERIKKFLAKPDDSQLENMAQIKSKARELGKMIAEKLH